MVFHSLVSPSQDLNGKHSAQLGGGVCLKELKMFSWAEKPPRFHMVLFCPSHQMFFFKSYFSDVIDGSFERNLNHSNYLALLQPPLRKPWKNLGYVVLNPPGFQHHPKKKKPKTSKNQQRPTGPVFFFHPKTKKTNNGFLRFSFFF